MGENLRNRLIRSCHRSRQGPESLLAAPRLAVDPPQSVQVVRGGRLLPQASRDQLKRPVKLPALQGQSIGYCVGEPVILGVHRDCLFKMTQRLRRSVILE